MVGGIRAIASRPFDGDLRKGPRHAYILEELRRRGCEPKVDRYGNIWVEKGSGRPLALFSSHIDIDPRVRRAEFRSSKAGNRKVLSGVLDNAVGCYINILLAARGPRKGRAIYVFTASEEVDRHNGRRWARSAKEVVRELKRRKLRPDFCVAIDVTYPKLRKPQSEMDWKEDYSSLFDTGDRTHCYLDGFSRPKVRRLAERKLKSYRHPRIGIRKFHGHDEACIYDRLAPSFAFGPVVFGHFDRADQRMPLAHLRTALGFLKNF
ncbi:MAG: hypothetical protein AB1324_07130 [Candidatus Micrarchaeota archaeon]